MNKNDIIRMAREVWGDDSGKPWHESAMVHLERFAALVAAAERESCAALKPEVFMWGTPTPEYEQGFWDGVLTYQKVIREKGKE